MARASTSVSDTRRLCAMLTASILGVGLVGVGSAAGASVLSVCANTCRYHDLSAALASAHNGDVIVVGPGAYAGGVTIDRDVSVIGAGAALTSIVGGGPVVSIGIAAAGREPSVSISGITISGGITTSSLGRTYMALGGGVFVAPGKNYKLGGSVTLTDVVVTANRVAPTSATNEFQIPCGVGRECPFAWAAGAGIDSWGNLTLRRTTVSRNVAAGIASDAGGAGIFMHQGRLDIADSVITDNGAEVSRPNGRIAEGGGITIDTSQAPGTASAIISNSTISGNVASLTNDLPARAGSGELIELNVSGGGIQIGDGVDTVIDHTAVRHNAAHAIDPYGEPTAYNSGIAVGDSALTMTYDDVSDNRTSTVVATSADSGPSGGALEADGPAAIAHTKITRNVTTATSADGDAATTAAFTVNNFNNDRQLVTLDESIVADNDTEASSTGGAATVLGGGIFNSSELLIRDSRVSSNLARARGVSGSAQGGGVWNGDFGSGPPSLAIVGTAISFNEVAGSTNVVTAGGGVYTSSPVTVTDSTITSNVPDQCGGC